MPLTESQGERVASMLTSRSVDPPSKAQLLQAIDEVLQTIRREVSSEKFDASMCVFTDGSACRYCGETHGHLLEPRDLAAKWAELNARSKALTPCHECGVVHIQRTHEEHRARLVAAFALYAPKAKHPVMS
jgi:hypothetical protein